MSKPKIAIIGAGKVGGGLGERFAKGGYSVAFGVRGGKDASELLAKAGPNASVASIEEAVAGAEIIFLAVPGSVAIDAARGLGDVSGKVVVDCNNPLLWDKGPVWNPPKEGSLTAALAAVLPGAHVLKAFNGFGAEYHADPKTAVGGASVFIAGDNADAKTKLSEVASSVGFSPVDAGPLRNAAVLENVAILWIHLALVGGKGREIVFQLVGRS